jgi:hypothetical protein
MAATYTLPDLLNLEDVLQMRLHSSDHVTRFVGLAIIRFGFPIIQHARYILTTAQEDTMHSAALKEGTWTG